MGEGQGGGGVATHMEPAPAEKFRTIQRRWAPNRQRRIVSSATASEHRSHSANPARGSRLKPSECEYAVSVRAVAPFAAEVKT